MIGGGGLSASSSASSSASGKQDNAINFNRNINFGGAGGNGFNPWLLGGLGLAALVALWLSFRRKPSR